MQTFQKDVLDPSVLDPSNAIDKLKIEMKQKNDMVLPYITMSFQIMWISVSPLTYQMG